jgi:GGDEF domain-containing protein
VADRQYSDRFVEEGMIFVTDEDGYLVGRYTGEEFIILILMPQVSKKGVESLSFKIKKL